MHAPDVQALPHTERGLPLSRRKQGGLSRDAGLRHELAPQLEDVLQSLQQSGAFQGKLEGMRGGGGNGRGSDLSQWVGFEECCKKLYDLSRPACLLLLYRRRILTCIAYHSLLLPLVFPSLRSQRSQHQAAHTPVLRYAWLGHLGRGVPQGKDALAW